MATNRLFIEFFIFFHLHRIYIVCAVTWGICLKPSGVWKRPRYVTARWRIFRCGVCIFVVDLFFFLSFFPPCPSILFLVSLTKTIDVFLFSALTFLKQSYYSTHLCEGQKMEASPHFSELQWASYPLILNLFEVLDCNGLTPICGNQVFWISLKKKKQSNTHTFFFF